MIFLDINKQPKDIQESDLMRKEFITLEQAKTFYDLYAKLIGFSTRKKLKKKKNKNNVS